MSKKKPAKLLSTSLVRLDLTLEEILIELSTMLAKSRTKEVNNLLDDYEELSKKAEELKDKSEKLIRSNSKQSKIYKSTTAKFVDSVEFSSIEHINVSNTVGKLPVEAKVHKNNVCDANITVNSNETFTIKKGSIICKSTKAYMSNINSEALAYRLKINDIANVFIPKGFTSEKLILKSDVHLQSEVAVIEFIYGRKLRPNELSDSVKVNNKPLRVYLKTGNTN